MDENDRMDESLDYSADVLYAKMMEAHERMEQKRAELVQITQQVNANPNRQLNDDPEAWQKNMELSQAIQEYLRLEKQYYKEDSRY